MRKILLTLAALAAFGIALPVATNSASAETVVIKKTHRDHGWRERHHDRVVVHEGRRHRDHDRGHGASLTIR